MIWQIVTGEYPPAPGGVSDYTRIVAIALAAAGDQVHVWAPPAAGTESRDPGVTIHRLPGHFGLAALTRLDRALRAAPESRWLVEYAPHALGWRAMNLPFCLWLYAHRACRPDVMFHEVMFPTGRAYSIRQNFLGTAHRVMAALTTRAAARVFVATPIWADLLRERLGLVRPAIWLPLPGTIPVIREEAAVMAVRERYLGTGRTLVGHLSTYPGATRELLTRMLPEVCAVNDQVAVLLMGRGSDDFRAAALHARPELASRLHATGTLPAAALSCHLSACDLLVQVYPDGVCARRTTLVSALEHQRAIATCAGPSTEPWWRQSEAVALADESDGLGELLLSLITDPARRARQQVAAGALYRERFDPRHMVAQLRAPS